jgi:hypothetical protein
MNGREYFRQLAKQLRIERLDPSQITHLEPLKLRRGAAESKLGGRITRDLRRLSPEETAEQRQKSEELLGKPERRFPAEDPGVSGD